MLKKPLSEQVVGVTGGSAGLGRAIARLAHHRGARVVAARGGDFLLSGAAVGVGLATMGVTNGRAKSLVR